MTVVADLRIPPVPGETINPVSPFVVNTAITVLGGICSIIIACLLYYLRVKSDAAKMLAEANVKLVDRVGALEIKLSGLNQAVVPISAAFQAILIKELTHFHTPEMDGLMTKLTPFTLTDDESERLAELLVERQRNMNDQISDSERDAAQMLPMVIKRVQADRMKTGLEAEPLVRIIVAEQTKD